MQELCRQCVLDKHLNNYPEGAPEELIRRYREDLLRIVREDDGSLTAPEAVWLFGKRREELFGVLPKDFTEIKRHFNEVMLSLEDRLEAELVAAADPLRLAVQYAMTGNFIDFSALDSVTEEQLLSLIGGAKKIQLDETQYARFREKAAAARSLAYLTDNCGEIVMDKLLLGELKRLNPDLEATAVVRGGPVSNDATVEDAAQVGLTDLYRVIGNGAQTEGTLFHFISREAQDAIRGADMVISKGQSNYETLAGSGLPAFYIFMCKCDYFTGLFGVPKFTGILTEAV